MYLQVNRRQFKCGNCQKPFSEELDFVAKKRTYTKRLAENILEQLKAGDILNVSRRNIEIIATGTGIRNRERLQKQYGIR